ncbi:MAG TPA: UPF0175 family protein [Methanosarcinaceae archaeon]|nr:UPF0175 family protein [Methanosarcinaceae archaeon]
MSTLALKIPGDIVDAIHLPPGDLDWELHKELSLELYQRGVLSSGKACALAEMTRWEFDELLGRYGISRHYTEQNLDEDIDYVRSHQ